MEIGSIRGLIEQADHRIRNAAPRIDLRRPNET